MNIYLIISIALISFFIIVFFVTFIINRKTPLPKGCEDIKISEENCSTCKVTDCTLKQRFNIEEIKDEVKEEIDNEKMEEDE